MLPAPDASIELAGGRRLAYDDIGDPSGEPIVYLHGCPDSRLTRHPDDEIAARAGVRLLAVDRPGYGASDPPADRSRRSMAADISALLDQLDVESCAVLGWSSGGQIALACATDHRVRRIGLVASTVPSPFDGTVDDAAAVVSEMLPFVVPDGLTHELAVEHVREGKSASYLADLESVPGLLDQLALGMQAATASGTTGVEFDLLNLMTPWEFALADVAADVELWYGSRDDVVAPAIGQELASELPHATLHLVEGASHLLLVTHWTQILESLRKEHSCP